MYRVQFVHKETGRIEHSTIVDSVELCGMPAKPYEPSLFYYLDNKDSYNVLIDKIGVEK